MMESHAVKAGGANYKVDITWNYENKIRGTHFFRKGKNLITIMAEVESPHGIKGYIFGSSEEVTNTITHKSYADIFNFTKKNLLT